MNRPYGPNSLKGATGDGGSGETGGPVVQEAFLGSDAVAGPGPGEFTFTLGDTPNTIALVMYDGAPLISEQDPGYTWAGDTPAVVLKPPYGTMPAAAKVLILKQ